MGSLMQVKQAVEAKGFWCGPVAPGLANLAFNAGLRPVGANFKMLDAGGTFTLVAAESLPGAIASTVARTGVWRGRVAPGQAEALFDRGLRPVGGSFKSLDSGGLVELRQEGTFAVLDRPIRQTWPGDETPCETRTLAEGLQRALYRAPVVQAEWRPVGRNEEGFQVLVPFSLPAGCRCF